MAPRVTAVDSFLATLPELDESDGAGAVAEKLITRVMTSPHRAEPIGDSKVRAVRGGTAGSRFPPLRLFYTIADDGTVTLLRLQRDE